MRRRRHERGFLGALLIPMLLASMIAPYFLVLIAEERRREREIEAALKSKPVRVEGLHDEAKLQADIEAAKAAGITF